VAPVRLNLLTMRASLRHIGAPCTSALGISSFQVFLSVSHQENTLWQRYEPKYADAHVFILYGFNQNPLSLIRNEKIIVRKENP
jgi:hypothetical protein